MMSKILFKGLFSYDKIVIHNAKKRTLADSAEIQKQVDEIWEEALQKAQNENRKIWNGFSLRLDSLSVKDDSLFLTVSPIDYKDRYSRERLFDTLSLQGAEYTGRGLAIGALVRTTDGYYAFGLSNQRSMNELKTEIIGGIVDNIELVEGDDLRSELLREVHEESSVLEPDIAKCEIIGIIQSKVGNIIIINHIELSISKVDLQKRFAQHPVDEFNDLHFVESSKLDDYLISMGDYKYLIPEMLENRFN